MQGANLEKAAAWVAKGIKMEEEGKQASMVNKCLDFAVKCEADGLKAGESWN